MFAGAFVDTTYMGVTVPSMRPPPYKVAPGVQYVALNALSNFRKRFDRYTVVGAGKAAMDACLWLLWHGIKSADLTWIRPGDAWLHDRANTQPGLQLADRMKAVIRVQSGYRRGDLRRRSIRTAGGRRAIASPERRRSTHDESMCNGLAC
jgi:hypothetical protein